MLVTLASSGGGIEPAEESDGAGVAGLIVWGGVEGGRFVASVGGEVFGAEGAVGGGD